MEIGWNMTAETTGGIVALWTCWLGNIFEIFYPYGYDVPDEIIMETLGVTYGKPVKDEYGDRKWAKFYAERIPDKLGRVWIEKDKFYSYGRHLPIIENQGVKRYYCGHNETNVIHTFNFTFCSEEKPDAPNASMEVIQPYKDKFVELFVKAAKLVGNIKSINLESASVLYTPEKLKLMGYKLEEWQEDNKRYYYCRDAKNENVEIVLESGNSVVPWNTVIRYPVNNDITAEELIKFIDSFDNSKEPINYIPLIAYYIEQERIYRDYN